MRREYGASWRGQPKSEQRRNSIPFNLDALFFEAALGFCYLRRDAGVFVIKAGDVRFDIVQSTVGGRGRGRRNGWADAGTIGGASRMIGGHGDRTKLNYDAAVGCVGHVGVALRPIFKQWDESPRWLQHDDGRNGTAIFVASPKRVGNLFFLCVDRKLGHLRRDMQNEQGIHAP